VVLGLAMAVSCLSLLGLPLTVGFLGKFYLFVPALRAGLNWLVVITAINAAIGAAYYLRIIATMFLRADPHDGSVDESDLAKAHRLSRFVRIGAAPALVAVGVSVGLTIVLGLVLPPTIRLTDRTTRAAEDEVLAAGGTRTAAPATPAAAAAVLP
jgi:NADH-quinone oxidoreductase subunit N